MGYTHYWEGTPNLDEPTIAHAKRIIAKVRKERIGIKGPLGTGNAQVNAKGIKFNGDAAHSGAHESFWIEPGHVGFAFCKTERKPYDRAVVAILILLARTSDGKFTWSSDGDEEDHEDGLALYGDTLR
jgi:hypothetical protein